MTRRILSWMLLFPLPACCAFCATTNGEPPPIASLSDLPVWDDGLAELSYFDAVDTLYGAERSYTRVLIVVRQWMSTESGIKVAPAALHALPVFKMNLSEQIATENYNYRYLVSIFLKRPKLEPFKLTASSQEWCGMTFKQMRWFEDHATVRSYSYYDHEGDEAWTVPVEAVPYEALLLVARDVVVRGEAVALTILPPARSTRAANVSTRRARLIPGKRESLTLPAGTFDAILVRLEWDGAPTNFSVVTAPPYQLIRYEMGAARGALAAVERRPYWDRSSRSAFHAVGNAP